MRQIWRHILIALIANFISLNVANAQDYEPTDACYYDAEYYTRSANLDPGASSKKFRDFLATLPLNKGGAHALNSEENFPAIRGYIDENWESDTAAARMRGFSTGIGCYGHVADASNSLVAFRKAADLGDSVAIAYFAIRIFTEPNGKKNSEIKRNLRDAIKQLQQNYAWARRDSEIEALEGLYLLVDLSPQLMKGRARLEKITETCQRFSRSRDLWPRNAIAHAGLSNCYQYTGGGWREDLTLSYAHWLAYLWTQASAPDTYSFDLERRLANADQVAEAKRLAYQLTDRTLPIENVAKSNGPAKNGQEKAGFEHTLSGSGTAFFISESLLATNAHVIADAKMIKVTVDGQDKHATVLVSDPDLDLAILKIDQLFDGKRACFSVQNSAASAAGTRIFAAGFPYSGILSSDAKITEGVVSSKNGLGGDPKTFQISAALQPGNSGGPVFDEAGMLVGIAVSKLRFGQNVNFAIKPLYLRALLESVGAEARCDAEFAPTQEGPTGFDSTLALVGNYQ